MTTRKTKVEIIDFVVNHIRQNGRSFTIDDYKGQECVYHTSDGRRCGHSICIDDEMAKKVSGTASTVIITYGDQIHKPEFRGHDIEFWRKIQYLHDDNSKWKDNELTAKGIEYVNRLKKEYAKN